MSDGHGWHRQCGMEAGVLGGEHKLPTPAMAFAVTGYESLIELAWVKNHISI